MQKPEIGEEIPSLSLPPISRHTLALYAGASGDHNPVHTDSDFAKKSGMSDVFAHGMLSMAYLGRLITDWRSPSQLKKLSTRFTAITHVHDVITCSGKVTEIFEDNGEALARCEILAEKESGEKTLIGEAIFAL